MAMLPVTGSQPDLDWLPAPRFRCSAKTPPQVMFDLPESLY
jgi:hypothetical protein